MPKRKRPKHLNKETLNHAKLRGKWKRWLPQMRHDLTDLMGMWEIFWQLQDVARENPAVLKPGSFFDWMCRNYMIAITVGIRSFMDHSSDSRSLWRMLYGILENPGVIDREVHVRMYRGTSVGVSFGHVTFDTVVGVGRPCLSQRQVRSDLHELENVSERIRRFVNKRVAHKTTPGEIRRLPKLHEVDSAIDQIDKVLCKYNLLLTGQGMDTLHAVRQYDWREVLWEPWIPIGSRLRP